MRGQLRTIPNFGGARIPGKGGQTAFAQQVLKEVPELVQVHSGL